MGSEMCIRDRESVAVYLPGEKNITADGLSRLQLHSTSRDLKGDRVLRKRLFQSILRLVPSLTLDGMAADDGHNKQLPRYCCPSFPIFEADFESEVLWIFPPDELISPVLRFLHHRRRARKAVRVVLLLPERPRAPWFFLVQHYKRIARYVYGSDLFRECDDSGVWRKLPRTREPWMVLSSV